MNCTILIVEDDETTARLYETILLNAGFQAVIAGNGVEAFEKMAVRQPDLILLDMRMPFFDGLKFCQLLREKTSSDILPVIMISAQSDQKIVETAMQAGVNQFITKPVSPKILIEDIEILLALEEVVCV